MWPTTPGAGARASQSGLGAADAKARLRARVLAARASDPHRADADAARLPRLLQACAAHRTVACYVSVAPEPDTRALLAALSDAGVRLLLPVLTGRRTPGWAWYTGPGTLVPGWRDIPQPDAPALGPEALAACTFVWVSALQVSAEGYRLGTGGGWYDRALRNAASDAVVGTLVNDPEVVAEVPVEPWDVPVNVVVTPTRTLLTAWPRLPRE
ncbi:MAG: 5-formyltetrahydrofolate cyclo-ligase [Actinomycetes bacterium]